MTAKEHYDKHLGNFYSWMTGDFETQREAFQHFLIENKILPGSTKIAIDLGAGHGLQSFSLAKLGFIVKAVDFNSQLLSELKENVKGLDVEIIKDDIRSVSRFADIKPELIICCGDTITHLDNKDDIARFIDTICTTLNKDGKVLLSFRDYSTALDGDNRFIPVKSDDTRILTCVLDYQPEVVTVTDLLHEKTGTGWQQTVSSYNKVRISQNEIVQWLELNKMSILFQQPINRMITIIATKQ